MTLTPGTATTIPVLSGYLPVQYRPFACRPACTCGTCYGITTDVPVTFIGQVEYADNSTELHYRDAAGNLHRVMTKAPSGDACF
jgi:hypothetical protein